jgi:hypothetical protein
MKKFGLLSILTLLLLVACVSNSGKKTGNHEEEVESIETLVSDSVFVSLTDLKHPSKETVENLLGAGIPFPDFSEFISYDPENKPSSYFFEIDFNDDGEMDIIYQGPSGGESDFVIFYLNKKGRYVEFFNEYQRLEVLIFIDQILNTIHMVQPGCCADHSFLQKQTHFVYHNGQFHAERIKTICSFDEPELKNRFQTPKEIEINATPYLLRYSPHIENDTFFYASNENEKPDWLIIGNQLGKLKKGDRGRAIAYEKDDTGREWWFVILNKEVRPTDNYFDYIIIPENANLQFSGWVSKKNVIVLK